MKTLTALQHLLKVRLTVLILILGSISLITACGGGGGSSSGGQTEETSDEGTLTVGVTDAPVDNAIAVVVEFTGVAVKPADADEEDAIEISFDEPRSIDLLALQGTDSDLLLDGETLQAGDYEWIRLDVNADQMTTDSFIQFETGGQVSLFIPSGSETGLKLVEGFVVPAGGSASFTIDFDLRKSVHDPVGQEDFILRPALRIVDNNEVGHIEGTVDSALLSADNCTAGDVVYVFEGSDVVPDDVDETEPEPVTSASVEQDADSGNFEFTAGFLSPGDYTLAFTCQGEDDAPGADDDIVFSAQVNATVEADVTATVEISGSGDGSVSLGVTDAPVDNAAKVVVEFTGVSVKPADDTAIDFAFDEARTIDLLALQGTDSESLLADEPLPPGQYEWVRLDVNALQGTLDSFIEFENGEQTSLFIPSGSKTGLKLVQGFVIPSGGSASFTIDFDLRRSVVDPQGFDDFFLKPALRIVDNNKVGHIAGTVDSALVNADSCTEGDAVYVFEGAGVAPDDVDDVDGTPEPLTSGQVKEDEESGDFQFEIGFLTPADYTLAFTCQASDDDPSTDDEIDFPVSVDVTVEANETVEVTITSDDAS